MIELQGVTKRYVRAGETVYALRDVNFSLSAGDMVAIVGPSGSGKSSLLNILGLLDRPDVGQHTWEGQDMLAAHNRLRAQWRNQRLGFVFQSFMLLPRLTAWENVALPLYYRQMPATQRREQALQILTRVGLASWAEHRPAQLSGGQQQRVAIARALVGAPRLILADEPTGALDSHTGKQVMRLLHEIHAAGTTVVLITHDAVVAQQCPRRLQIQDGVLTDVA